MLSFFAGARPRSVEFPHRLCAVIQRSQSCDEPQQLFRVHVVSTSPKATWIDCASRSGLPVVYLHSNSRWRKKLRSTLIGCSFESLLLMNAQLSCETWETQRLIEQCRVQIQGTAALYYLKYFVNISKDKDEIHMLWKNNGWRENHWCDDGKDSLVAGTHKTTVIVRKEGFCITCMLTKSRQRWGMQVLQERGPYSISSEETNIIFDSEKNHREVGFTMFIKTGHLQRPGQALAIRSTFLLLRFFGRKGKATPRGKDLQNFHPSQGFQIGGRTSIVVHSPANVQVSLASA